MNVLLLSILLGCSAILLIFERMGVRTTLSLSFRGDIKRETLFLAQWGQFVCTPLVALVVWQLDRPHIHQTWAFMGAVAAASVACFLVKRLLGRVRPDRENAGQFLGPSLKHANWRESFPSSHSACAVALSVYLAHLYPAAAITFWCLGLVTSALRFVLNAHFPSDVLAGIAIGYACAIGALAIVPV